MGVSHWWIPHGGIPHGGSHMGESLMGDCPWGIPSWGIPHRGFPHGGSPMGIHHFCLFSFSLFISLSRSLSLSLRSSLNEAHIELTVSQLKKLASTIAQIAHDLLRKVGFMERRQQRQLPSLAEVNREFVQAAETGFFGLCCAALEGCHFYFLANSIMGFLCFPVHVLLLCCSRSINPTFLRRLCAI